MNTLLLKDDALWQVAKRRAGFKISFFAYVSVNCLLIAIWYFSNGAGTYFWPKWAMLGWGVGIATQYFYAYHGSEIFSAHKEFEKLKNKQQQ